ncbi:TPA: tail fiber protein [Escherichia coli]
MGADKTNNIMTLSSGVSQPLLADVQYFELYSSSALNRKLKNIVLPGFYCGFEPVPGTGLSVRITSENSEGKGAASVDVNNVQISVQQIEDVTVSVKAGATNIIVLEANFEHGVKTTQVESASSVSAARIYARTDNTIGQNQIELCRVIVPNGATAVTKEMIVLKYRVNRAVGVEFSNEISSTEERKAATPLAVKTLHDLVDTKAPLDSPHLSGTPTSPTPEPGTNNTQIANAAFVKAAITALINGAPGTLDTLKEIAAAINNDPNFSTTINNALALKAPLASPALTGIPTAPTAAQGTNNTQIATTAYVRAAISALVGSSPEALDTLNELAAALGNDPNFATTMTNALAGKQPLDATLTALAALATGANKLPYFTGKDTVAQTDLTSVGRDILAKTSTLAVIQYLGLRELGTSGEKIPLLSTANTWSARQTFNGGITGALTGNADTATKLKTARTIGGVSFDGSANIDLPGVNKTGNQSTTGNAATATKLQTARNINGVPFDGTKDITLTPKDLDAYSKSEVQSALAGKQPLDNTLTNLSGKDVAGLLAYLQLGEAAKRDVGTGNNQLPDMSAFGMSRNGQTAWDILPNGMIRQVGTVTLTPVGNFNAQVLGGVTYYTHYYRVNFPRQFPNAQIATLATLASYSFSTQSSMAGKSLATHRDTDSGTDVSRTRFTVSYTTPNLGEIPTLHFEAIGY